MQSASPHAGSTTCGTIYFDTFLLLFFLLVSSSFHKPDCRSISTATLTLHTLQSLDMAWFIPFVLLLAGAWAVVGILLAKWIKQAGHNRPFNSRHLDDKEIYGGGVGFGREVGLGGSSRDVSGVGRAGPSAGGRVVGLGGYGEGRVKGL
jgi:hypothetical protein